MTRETILAAIDAGDEAAVERLLGEDPGLAALYDDDGVSAVLQARYRGAVAIAERIADARDPDVFEAAALGRVDRLDALLSADPALAAAWSPDGFTVLHYAAFFGGGDVARRLLAAGADPDLRSRNDFSVMPIHSAVAGRHADVVDALLEAGADPNVAQRHGYTPLHGAAEHGDDAIVVRLLVAGAAADAVDDEGLTPADRARKNGHEALYRRLGGA
jgi:uncharacterized protein